MLASDFAVFLSRFIPTSLHARLHFRAKLGYWPNLSHPATFSERLQARKVTERDALIALTADKYRAREYIRSVLGEGYLPELYAVVDRCEDIDVDALPPAYAMKATHGSGWNRLVWDGELTTPEARLLAEQWLRRSYYWVRREWAYKPLKPRVLFEENLARDRKILDDYKFFCFQGVPRMIQVDRGRFTNHYRAYFDPKWRQLRIACKYPLLSTPIQRPSALEQLLDVASRLAEPFEFARIDLYALPGRIVAGEITHYPESGIMPFAPPEFDRELGDVWASNRPISNSFLMTQS